MMNTTDSHVSVRREENVLVIVINRPKERNALDPLVAQQLLSWIRDPGEGVGAIVLTGAPPAFCAGGDLAYLTETMSKDAGQATEAIYQNFHALIRGMLASRVPLVAAVNGPALGAGLDLALACDLRVAGASATFASSWIRMGLATGMGGSWLLARAIGGSRAAEMLLLGEAITAQKAEYIGLVNHVVGDDEQVVNYAFEIAKRLAALPAAAVVATRSSLRRAIDVGIDAELQMLGVVQGTLLTSKEFALAAQRFLKPRT